MTPRDFCYWLQGYFEVADTEAVTEDQVKIIKKHLNLVFEHVIDPSFGPKEIQEKLNKIHSGGSTRPPNDLVVRC